ncbi:MAG: Hsp70 family protein [Acidimicrobiales bacterium]
MVHISLWGELTVGEAAERRAASDPQGVMRAFTARLGDDVGCVVRDQMWSAEVLLAVLLQHVMNVVREQMGSDPRSVVLTHPPSWGCYKQERLREAARLAKLSPVQLAPAPVAVAMHHMAAAQQGYGADASRTSSLVLDLGGRSGSVTMVRFGASVAGLLAPVPVMGVLEGIEVGGADFDESLRALVEQLLGRSLHSLDDEDAAVVPGLAQLCVGLVSAKEQLSEQTSVEVALPFADLPPSVRVTRSEFEHAIAPHIAEVVAAAHRVQHADDGTEPEMIRLGSHTAMAVTGSLDHRGGDTLVAEDGSRLRGLGSFNAAPHQILLSGGSARVPLLGRTLAHELGLPVVMDADPKAAVACGAALLAAVEGRQLDGAGQKGSRADTIAAEAAFAEALATGSAIDAGSGIVIVGAGGDDGSEPRSTVGEPSPRRRLALPATSARPLSGRRLGLMIAALLVAAVMVGGGLALRGLGGSSALAGADEPLAVARYASPVMQFSDGFVEARQWALHVAEQRLLGTVTVTNNGTNPGSRRVEEIFPSTLVEDLGTIEFVPVPDRLDAQNLSVGYDVNDLASGKSESFSYELAVSVDAEEAQHRLSQWGRDRDRLAAVRATEPAVSLQSLTFERTSVDVEEGSVVPMALTGVLTNGAPADRTMLAGIALVSSEPSVARAGPTASGGWVELHGKRAGRSVVVAQSGSVRASVAVAVRKPASASTVASASAASGPGTTSDQPRLGASASSGSSSTARSSAGTSSTEASEPSSGSPSAGGVEPATRAPVGKSGVAVPSPEHPSSTPGTAVGPTGTTSPPAADLPPADAPTTTVPANPSPTSPPVTDPPPPETTPTTTQPPSPPPTDPPVEPPPDPTTTTTTTTPPVDPPADPPVDPPPPDPAPVV